MMYDVIMAFIAWGTVHWFIFGWIAFFAITTIVSQAAKIPRFTLSTVKVLARGWPPAHLDADGDWRPKDEV